MSRPNSAFDGAVSRKITALVDAMAQVLIETGAGATEADLVLRGFSAEDIATHGSAAAAIANSRRVRHLEKAGA